MNASPASFRCKCGHEWTNMVGPSNGWLPDGTMNVPHPPPGGCPSCGGVYFLWINYDSEFSTI